MVTEITFYLEERMRMACFLWKTYRIELHDPASFVMYLSDWYGDTLDWAAYLRSRGYEFDEETNEGLAQLQERIENDWGEFEYNR
jgi:hypothetical protein